MLVSWYRGDGVSVSRASALFVCFASNQTRQSASQNNNKQLFPTIKRGVHAMVLLTFHTGLPVEVISELQLQILNKLLSNQTDFHRVCRRDVLLYIGAIETSVASLDGEV